MKLFIILSGLLFVVPGVVLLAWSLCRAASDWQDVVSGDDGEPSCDGCRHYLGGGQCRINLEKECAAGNFEAWEAPEHAEH